MAHTYPDTDNPGMPELSCSSAGDTKTRILQAAEQLLAEHGFANTSLRAVTRKAGANIAAVNYHFGSKDKLLEKVFVQRLDVLNETRTAAMDAFDSLSNHDKTLNSWLGTFIKPALALSADQGDGGSVFIRVLARAYVEMDSTLRRLLSQRYGHVMRRFANGIEPLLPNKLEPEELRMRIDFMMGALTYCMSDPAGARTRKQNLAQVDTQELSEKLIDFCVAGLKNPIPAINGAST